MTYDPTRPDHIICLWEWGVKEDGKRKGWKLIHTYCYNDAGRPLVKEAVTVCDWVDMGEFARAVTVWTFFSGVGLLSYSSPNRDETLSPTITYDIGKRPGWSFIINDGNTLLLETEQEARKVFIAARQTASPLPE